ncbi:Single myb histone 5 [Linum perenne]
MGWIAGVSHLENEARQEMKMASGEKCELLPDQSVPTRRRRKRKWSSEEEAALKNGIKEFEAGFWKEILNSRRDEFNDRTEVDLKDKWRNMSKHVPR